MVALSYICLGAAMLIVVLLLLEQTQQTQQIQPLFKEEKYNRYYRLSFSQPIVQFIDETERSKEARDIKDKLLRGGLAGQFNYRSFVAYKVYNIIRVVGVCGVLYVALFSFANIPNLTNDLVVRAQYEVKQNINSVSMIMALLVGVAGVYPQLMLNNAVSKAEAKSLKDMSIVQSFIILMLKSKVTVAEVIDALAIINTSYRDIFSKAELRMLIARDSAFEYLEDKLKGSMLQETAKILRDFPLYSRADSIKALENCREEMDVYIETTTKQKSARGLLLSQVSLVLPFVSLATLVLMPIYSYAMSMIGGISDML